MAILIIRSKKRKLAIPPAKLLEAQLQRAVLAKQIPAFVTEYRFHPTRKWRADFAILSHKVLLECEGGTWQRGGSRHTRGAGFENDCEKYLEAQIMGFTVLRVTSDQVRSGYAIDAVLRYLKGENDEA